MKSEPHPLSVRSIALTTLRFSIYQLRAGYLNNIKDGVGERLITLNTSVLNNPAFRAAGWTANPAELKRTYSPPIPTAIASDYFQVPPRSAGLPNEDGEEEGGMVTGMGSNDTLGPTLQTKRRRRKEQLEEDDSSDLSDDSDEEDEGKRAAQQIKFNKMPVRLRSGSSPTQSSKLKEEVSFLVTSPSKPPEADGLRRGSLGAVDTIKQRARRDTTTSSEFSSENELDPATFRRQRVQNRAIKHSQMLATQIQEEEQEGADSDLDGEGVDEASDLSDDFDNTVESESLLGLGGAPLVTVDTLEESTPPKEPPNMPPAVTSSPKKTRPVPPELPRLPSGRPISYVQPVSLLSKAFQGKEQKSESPLQQFAQLYGKGESSPLWIKIYAPFSEKPTTPIEVPIRPFSKEGVNVNVIELIGLSLWRYGEEKLQPELKDDDLNVNRWTLRMVEDGEVDFDFPALMRTRPVSDFTSNNNRPARGRARDKPWDEFGLVRANDEQFRENEELTPQFGGSTTVSAIPTPVPDTSRAQTPVPMQRTTSDVPPAPSFIPNRNPITGPSFALSALRKNSTNLLDAPAAQAPRSTPRNGVPRTVSIHYLDPHSLAGTMLPIETTSDTYLAEIFTTACQRLKLDKALHVLKVHGTQTIAPQDRTVEALGDRLHLDMIRRRFYGDGSGISGSPGSESPNAPLLLTTGTTPKKKKSAFGAMGLHGPKAADLMSSNNALLSSLTTGTGKRYQVIRRQPLSFAPSHPRVLAFDGEYMHIMAGGEGELGTGKTTSVHLSSVVGCKVSRKHPKIVRVFVYREKETKRYDFEANSANEANEINAEIRKGVERFGAGEELLGYH
ncbi:Component of a membrane-bound complex containing the Tor2p kinase [Zalaria obscura]|uniref:Component of a membrane-bound complex containing the Tor2p kinase n=1 Tax=Zalaria obscura TaxID=2024903 RepID=A0ACC3S9H8_9PEZI